MKEQLCRAFCDELVIRRLPSGIDAVDTAFSTSDGDSIGFFLKEVTPDIFEIRDAGIALPSLVAGGLDLKNPTRQEAFSALLNEYGVAVDEDEQEFAISGVDSAALPKAALRFVSFMLRVGDLLLLAEERAASTFRNDVKRLLEQQLAGRAHVFENEPVVPDLDDFLPDFTMRPSNAAPIGVFLGTSDARVLEALYMQMRAEHELHQRVSIVALLEREKLVSARVRQQANNRLTAVPNFRGDEAGAIARIIKEANLATIQ